MWQEGGKIDTTSHLSQEPANEQYSVCDFVSIVFNTDLCWYRLEFYHKAHSTWKYNNELPKREGDKKVLLCAEKQ